MNTESFRKYTIILIVVLVVIIGAALGLNYYFELKRQQEIKQQSTEFIEKWANFKDETTDSYLNSVKPFMETGLYNDLVSSTEELKNMNASGSYQPNESKFTAAFEPTIKKSGKDYVTTTEGTRQYNDESSYTEVVELTWSKVGNTYLITDINANKK